MSHKYLYDLFSTAEYLNSFEFNDRISNEGKQYYYDDKDINKGN